MQSSVSSISAHLTEIRYQVVSSLLLPTILMLFLVGCSENEPRPPGSKPDATLPAAKAAPLEPGDARFLLGHGNVIDSATLSGQETNLVTLAGNVNVLDMSLSEDKQQLAFVVELPAYTNDKGEIDFGADLFVSDADGANARRVLRHGNTGDYFEAPAWLNDTTLLVGSRGYDPATNSSFSLIERVDLASGGNEVVLRDAAMGALSPDRTSIVYMTIDSQTRVQRLVVEDIAADDEPRVLVDEYDKLALFSSATFSPDGTQLAFAAVDLSTSTKPPELPTAPSGSHTYNVALATTHPFAEDVWLVNTDGTDLRRLGDLAENIPSISWAGDGSKIYALGPAFLWRIDPVAGEAEMIRQSNQRGSIIWLEGN
jgi:Tol biopolymer transport system component